MRDKEERGEEREFQSGPSNIFLDSLNEVFGSHVGSITWYPKKFPILHLLSRKSCHVTNLLENGENRHTGSLLFQFPVSVAKHKISTNFTNWYFSLCLALPRFLSHKIMEPDIQSKIEETVSQILKTSNMDEMTEYKIRQKASEELGLDLSPPDRKKFVRKVVEAYLTGLKEEPELDEAKNDAAEGEEDDDDEEEEEEGQGKRKRGGGAKEYDDNGDLIICKV